MYNSLAVKGVGSIVTLTTKAAALVRNILASKKSRFSETEYDVVRPRSTQPST